MLIFSSILLYFQVYEKNHEKGPLSSEEKFIDHQKIFYICSKIAVQKGTVNKYEIRAYRKYSSSMLIQSRKHSSSAHARLEI